MPYGIPDRKAALTETALPTSVNRIQTDAFDFDRPEHIIYQGTEPRPRWLRQAGAALYYRCDPPPTALQSNKAFLHFPNDANAPPGGSWFLLEPQNGENNFFQLGAVHSNYADFTTGAAENLQAIYDHMHLRASDWYCPNHILYIPSGWFAVADTVVCKAGTVHLTGKREGRDGAKACLGFPGGKDWFIVHYDNTNGNNTSEQVWVPPEGDRRSASFSVFQGFGIFGEAAITKDYRPKRDGIVCRARATIDNMWLSGACRHAIDVVTSISAAMDNPKGEGNEYAAGNANSTRITWNSIQWCGGSGIRCIGSDSNAVMMLGNETNFCGWSGIEETSFLGPNAIIGHHTTDCGIGVGSTFSWGYQHDLVTPTKPGCYAYVTDANGGRSVYVARGPHEYQQNAVRWQELVDTEPGTNDWIWVPYAYDPAPSWGSASHFAKEWLPNQEVGTYTWAAPRFIAGVQNYSGSIFCYDEGSQPPAQYYTPRGTHRGNACGGFILKGSYGDIWDEGITYGPVTIREDYYNQAKKQWENIQVTLGHDENGVLTFGKLGATAWGDGFQPKLVLNNGDLETRYADNPPGVMAITAGAAGSHGAADGSGRPFEPGTHIARRFAVATPDPGQWKGVRIDRRKTSQIGDPSSMFTNLGAGDVILNLHDTNPDNPNLTIAPEGWGAHVISNAPNPRGSMQYIRWGQYDDEVLGSLPPPPPPDEVDEGGWSGSDRDSGITVSTDALTVETTANGHRIGRGTVAHDANVHRFEVTVTKASDPGVGFATAAYSLGSNNPLGYPNSAPGVVLFSSGWVQGAGISGQLVSGADYDTGDVVAAEYDEPQGKVRWYVNGTQVFEGSVNFADPVFPAYDLAGTGDKLVANFSPDILPTGVLPWVEPETP